MKARDKVVFVIGRQAGYSREIVEILEENGFARPHEIDNLLEDAGELVQRLARRTNGIAATYYAAPGVPGIRQIIDGWASEHGLVPAMPLVHKSSSISSSVRLGEGTTVNRLVSIAAAVIVGKHVQINRSSSIGHDCRIGDFSSIGPGALLAGGVTVGPGSFIGAGAVLTPGLTLGENSVIGAGSVLRHPVAAFETWVGNPAKAVRVSESGYKGFTVKT